MSHLVEIEGLYKHFPIRRGALQGLSGQVRAVDGVDLSIVEGECLAVVGESGSGKSTLARCVLALEQDTRGQVRFAGEDLLTMSEPVLRRRRREFQMIFQDPSSSLNPRMTVGELIAEPLEIFERSPSIEERRRRVLDLLDMVGLSGSSERSYPYELSGGQRQRVAIARALATKPRFLVADEPVASLDVSLRGQILNLLMDLRDRLGLTVVIIAHDLALIEQIADRVAVMYAGRIVELAPAARFYQDPQHPYSRLLLAVASGSRKPEMGLDGEPIDLTHPPAGCRFGPRCPIRRKRCAASYPNFLEIERQHRVACFYPGKAGENRSS